MVTSTTTITNKESIKWTKYIGCQDDDIVYAYTKTEARKSPRPVCEMPPLFDEPTTLMNFHLHIHWLQSLLLISTPLIGLYGAWTTPLYSKTLYWALIYYFITGLGITGGYHRLWAHRSYRAPMISQILFCLAGSGAVEGSIQWWSRGHRAHHRWTDTDKDPYAATRGFFFSHIGWMLVKRPKSRIGYADVADLKKDKLIQFQHAYYPWFALFMGFLFPCLVAGLFWDDYKGGFIYAGVCRLVFVHHATFCVNSLAHYIGETTYDDYHTPKDHWLTALVTCGEGYHNFHHEFPQDYRNAIVWYQYDPTKLLIKILSLIGLAYDLKKFPTNEIIKGKLQMEEKRLLNKKKKLCYGKPIEELPIYTWEEFQNQVQVNDKKWILIEGILYDVENFDHPGGCKYLWSGIGKDMTTTFNGAIYNHSNGARHLLTSMRIGVLKNGMELMRDRPDVICYDSNMEINRKSK
ncbi:stearoyl-CoA desaturase [Halteromyces radiatus]|uniref:stearoyl-CoA desaturase n=1 Tax=Halteromyces radiatus TaxID=101107 RepID=UPI00221FF0C4|nr:stearoyl-CoA desaturase [Halteromyces radiatus]KAI8089489.1 stearoyl-CoA desaturase [Halteromyces radiatus]